MSRRRVILIGIIVSCVAMLVLSVMGVWRQAPKPMDDSANGPRAPVPNEQKPTDPAPKGPSGSRITEMEYPEFNDDGTRKYVVRAKEALERIDLKNAPLVMKNAEIVIYDVPGKEPRDPHKFIFRGKEPVKIKADGGTYDRATSQTMLESNVVIQVDAETTITTEEICYIPRQQRVFTEKGVDLHGKDIEITGTGLEGNLTTNEIQILRDVKVIIRGTRGFTFTKKDKEKKRPEARGPTEAPKKPLDEPVTITCTKELTFTEVQRRATFHENVKVVRGPSRLDADTLEITFDKAGESVKKVTAIGNVSFEDKDIAGKADRTIWTADNECAVLTSAGMAEIHQGQNRIRGKTIRLFQPQEKMTVDCPGDLLIISKGGLKPDDQLTGKKTPEKDKKPKKIEIFWERDMLYQANEADFRGNVRAVEEDGIRLNAERLQVTFDRATNKLKKILATDSVTLVDKGRKATGNRLEWDAVEGMGVLTSDDTVKVEDESSLVSAKTLRFWQVEDKLVAEGGGFLVGSKLKKDGKDKETIHVIWEKGMNFDRKKHEAVFQKNVEAMRGKTKLLAQELNVLFDENNRQVRKIVAKEKVEIKEDNQSGSGEEATYDAATEDAVLVGGNDKPAKVVQEGGRSIEAPVIYLSRKTNSIRTDGGGNLVFQMKEKEGKREDVTVAWKGQMEFDSEKHKAVFRENVRARQGERKINSDLLEVFFDDKNREVEKLVATDNVSLTEGNRNGEGDQFTWNAADGMVEMLGKGERQAVMRSDQGLCIKSATIRHYQNEDKMEARGRGILDFVNPHAKSRPDNNTVNKIKVQWQDRLEFPRAKGQATFYGDVVVTSGTRRLEAGKLDIFLDEKEEPREMHAYENVVVSESGEEKEGQKGKLMEGLGDELVWTSADDTAILSGENGARLYNAGQLIAGSQKWYFEGFFTDDIGKKRIKGDRGQGPVVIHIPGAVSK